MYGNGILIETREGARFSTDLDPAKHPKTNDKGLSRLNIHGCMQGCGIRYQPESTTAARMGVYACDIHGNPGGAALSATLRKGHPAQLQIQENQLYDNGDGGIAVEVVSGTCAALIVENTIFDTPAATNSGYAGIRLQTMNTMTPLSPAVLDASLNGNHIRHLQGKGMELLCLDQGLCPGVKNRLEAAFSNDRLHHNLLDGLYLHADNPSYSELGTGIMHLSSCDNGGMGISFDDAGHEVNVVNGIFWGNTGDDVGPGYYGFEGTISYCDWGDGYKDGGYNHDPLTCLSSDPLFKDLLYHLQYNPSNYSPCVDRGDNAASLNVNFDMEGNRRRIDGDQNGTIITDMGADEHKPDGP